MKLLKRFAAFLLCLPLLVSAVQSPALAAAIDTAADVRLTITYIDEGVPVVGSKFEFFRVADTDQYVDMKLCGKFADYPVVLTDLGQTGWRNLALTLKGYAQRDRLTPDVAGAIGEDGTCSFVLKPGLYLMVDYPVTIDGCTYTPLSSMVFLPGVDPETGDWVYDVNIIPKHSKEIVPEDVKKITCKALKIWDDQGQRAKRPDSITVRLFCDGTEYDVQVLDERCNWRYTWNDLEANHDWNVVEDEVDGYTTVVSLIGSTFTVTNTEYVPEDPSPTPTPGPDDDPEKKLPQTGMLWWPVPVLLAAGLILCLIGFVRRRESGDDDE